MWLESEKEQYSMEYLLNNNTETILPQLKNFIRNEKGFPLNNNGEVDWEQTEKEKNEFANRFYKQKKNKLTNYTPPKKKRK